MLKTSTIINTWGCDNCGLESVAEVNPFFKIIIGIPILPNFPNIEIDLCQECIKILDIQSVVDYTANLNFIP